MSAIRDELIDTLWQRHDPWPAMDSADATCAQATRMAGDAAAFDGPCLAESVRRLRPRLVLDIGAGDGASTVHIARVLRDQQIDGVVIAVDTWLGSWKDWRGKDGLAHLRLASGRPTLQERFACRVKGHDVCAHVLPLPLDDVNAARVLARVAVRADLIHLNVRDDRPPARSLLKLWWPLLRESGLLIGHLGPHDDDGTNMAASAFQAFAAEHELGVELTGREMRVSQAARRAAGTHQPLLVRGAAQEPPGTLEYEGEFGSELVLFLPYVTWLSKAGLLRQHRITTYRGMRCFYDHLECAEVIEKDAMRRFVPPDRRPSTLPVRNENTFDGIDRSPFHLYPDLRRKFIALPLAPELAGTGRPLLVIHNKVNDEWKRGPINHISCETLDALFTRLARHFTVCYIRHGMTPSKGFSDDHSYAFPFDDRAVLDGHRDVKGFDDVFERYQASGGTQDLNTFKNVLYSRCFHFISSQGGGTSQIVMFSGSLLMVLHRAGTEADGAYTDGYYTHASNPATILAVCATEQELIHGTQLFTTAPVMAGRVMLSRESAALLEALAPATLKQRLNLARPATRS